METPDVNDEFLHQIRVQPHPRFANRLKMKLNQSSSEGEPVMPTSIHAHAPLSRRSVALIAIGGLHAAFILAFTNAFTDQVTKDAPPPFIADFFPETKEQPLEEPVARDPVLEQFPADDPTPPPAIDYTDEAPVTTTVDPQLVARYSGATTEGPSGSYVRASLAKRFPNPESFYPPGAIRQELEGKALVRVCVGPDGKLVEVPQIVEGTQSRLLDEAALRLARAGSYVAGSRDGVPITDCFSFQAKFQLDRGKR